VVKVIVDGIGLLDPAQATTLLEELATNETGVSQQACVALRGFAE
jgi:hypothetical protein